MMKQLEEVPKMVSQHVVLLEPVCQRIFGQGGVIQATEISSQDQNLQRTVEQTLADYMGRAISQIMEENFEVDKIVIPERVPKEIRVQNGVIEATKTSSKDMNLQGTVEQDPVEVDKTTPQERISERMGKQIRGVQVTEISSTMEQILDDTRHEPLSRISERIRELRRVLSSFEKKKRKQVLRFLLEFEHCVPSSE